MLRAGLQTADHLVNLVGRHLSTVREVAYFIGHYGETAPCFTGTCGFDCCVKRQQVGLLGNAFDDVENMPDVIGTGIELFDLRA